METINLSNTHENVSTSIKIDNGTNYKDLQVSQGALNKSKNLFIQIDKENDTIEIEGIFFSGINKAALLSFITQ